MNIDHVSLEVAQKLQKAEYWSECERNYIKDFDSGDMGWKIHNHLFLKDRECLPAPSAVQLANELPHTSAKEFNWDFVITHNGDDWEVSYVSYLRDEHLKVTRAKTLPDALGLIMIYLLEQGLIKK